MDRQSPAEGARRHNGSSSQWNIRKQEAGRSQRAAPAPLADLKKKQRERERNSREERRKIREERGREERKEGTQSIVSILWGIYITQWMGGHDSLLRSQTHLAKAHPLIIHLNVNKGISLASSVNIP